MVVAHALLRRAEAAVVGGGGLQHARLQAAPQLLLVLPGTERRAHPMGGSVVPLVMPVTLVVHQQLARQHLPVPALTLVARTGKRMQRFSTEVVHPIERDVGPPPPSAWVGWRLPPV